MTFVCSTWGLRVDDLEEGAQSVCARTVAGREHNAEQMGRLRERCSLTCCSLDFSFLLF